MTPRLSLVLALPLLLAGCTSSECEPGKLPNRGHASTPEDLAQIAQHEAHHECWSPMYDLLSKKTRDKHGRTAWRIGVSSLTIPEYGYKVVDVVEKGKFLGALPNPADPNESFALYDYQEPGKRPLHAKVLIRREPPEDDDDGKVGPEWRIALEDQDEHLRNGDGRYWWFDESVPDNAAQNPPGAH